MWHTFRCFLFFSDGHHETSIFVDGSEFWFVKEPKLAFQEAMLYCNQNGSKLAVLLSSTAASKVQWELQQVRSTRFPYIKMDQWPSLLYIWMDLNDKVRMSIRVSKETTLIWKRKFYHTRKSFSPINCHLDSVDTIYSLNIFILSYI